MRPLQPRWPALAALVGWFALGLQLYLILLARWQDDASLLGGLVQFSSFFTVLSNTWVACVLTSHHAGPDTGWRRFFRRPVVSAAVLVSIMVVSIAYNLLLRPLWQPQGLQWLANELLHNVMPVVFALYWVLCVPKGALRLWHVAAWAVYPVVYFAYAMLRGQVIGVYQYPFIDVARLGMSQVWVNALGVLAGFVAVSVLVVVVDRCWGRRSAA